MFCVQGKNKAMHESRRKILEVANQAYMLTWLERCRKCTAVLPMIALITSGLTFMRALPTRGQCDHNYPSPCETEVEIASSTYQVIWVSSVMWLIHIKHSCFVNVITKFNFSQSRWATDSVFNTAAIPGLMLSQMRAIPMSCALWGLQILNLGKREHWY